MNNSEIGQQSHLQDEVSGTHGKQSHYRSTFAIQSRRIKNNHKISGYLDYGFSQSGPWLLVGFNEVEYGIGYQPGQTFKPSAVAAPSLRVAPDLA